MTTTSRGVVASGSIHGRTGRAGWLLPGMLALLLVFPGIGRGAPTGAAIEQTLDLVKSYLQSKPAERIRESDDENAKELLANTVALLESARKDLAAGNLESADDGAKQAMRSFSAAVNAWRAGDHGGDPAVANRNVELVKEIGSYRQSFLDGLKEKGPEYAHLLDVGRLDDLLARADTLSAEGQHTEARRLLDEAYQIAVSAITRLRNNETLVYRLEFRTPADEYRYEQDRNRSYELLYEQLHAAGHGQGMTAELVNKYLAQAKRLTGEGGAQAEQGDYQQAIKTMEEANKNMVRALQMMGLDMPGAGH